MNTEALQHLTKEELIAIIKDLDKKYSLENKVILPVNIDFKSLLEATSDIIFVIDKEERLVYRNSAWKMLYPSMRNDAFGEHYSNYLPDIEKDRAHFVFSTVINEGKTFENEVMKTFDEKGTAFYFITSFSPIRGENGQVMGLVGIMKNMTDRYYIEKKYRESLRILEEKVKEQLRQADEIRGLKDLNEDIISNAPIGIFTMDPSGIMLSENPALKRIMGRGPNETIVGVNLLNHKGFRDAGFDKLFEQGLQAKKPMRIMSTPYKPYAGKNEIIINVTIDPIIGKNESVEKVIIMVEDVTDYVRTMQRAAKTERIASLGFLASGVASELRNNINEMTMDINFIENNLEDNSPAKEYADSLKLEIDRIKTIAEQLLSLSIIDEREKDLVELNKILTNHPLDIMINRLQSEGFQVELSMPEVSPVVKAAVNQVQQIIIQTIENAVEAMPEKGRLKVEVDTMPSEKGRYAITTITDSGIGIPEENIKRIFQPFFTTKGKKATGLGLMIVSTIIENLGGTIGIKSRPGEGTAIRIALPAVEK